MVMSTERRHRGKLLAVSAVLAVVLFRPASGEDPQKKDVPQPQRTKALTGSPHATLINVGNITSWLWADGGSNRTPRTYANGCYFPRGTSSVIFTDGLVWGGKLYLDAGHTQVPPSQLIRLGGQIYYAGTQGGSITGQGAGARPVDPGGPGVRVYRIRREYASHYHYDYFKIRQEAGEYYERDPETISQAEVDSLMAWYIRDWREWPVQLGAPYIERNGIPGYQPPPPLTFEFTLDSLIGGHYDEPGVAGADPSSPADEVLFTVANDLDYNLTRSLYGSDPIGMELQITRWAYRLKDPLANSYFTRYRLINKGGVDWTGDQAPDGSFYIDSMYIAQWSDPDIGDPGNDLCGCDPGLNLGFAYNGYPSDNQFTKFSLPPPAIGYDILQGPIVPSPGDTAAYDMGVRPGFKNLTMTSFVYFGSGEAIGDPPLGYEGTLRWWKMLRGYRPTPSTSPDVLFPAPPGTTPTFFPLSGDPLSGQGFVDGLGTDYSLPPGDRRIVMNTGPFRFAPGDTQEVVIGTVGGLGADNLTSVSVLKYSDRFVQSVFDRRFAIPMPPSPPHVAVTERDREIILDWGSDLQRVRETEDYISSGGHAFEGYEVYQLPSLNSPRSEWVHLVTLDLNNGLRTILDEEINPETGLPTLFVSHRGNDTGIQRDVRLLPWSQIRVEMDTPVRVYLPGLVNGEERYFAVTAYSYSRDPGTIPRSLESDPVIVTARAKMPFGREYSVMIGDTLAVTHVGASQATATPIVVNPDAGTGDSYEVRFDTTGGSLTWSLTDVTQQTTVADRLTTAAGDQNPIVAGVQLSVIPSPGGMTGWRTIPYSYSPSSGAAWTATNAHGLNLEGFGGAIGNAFDHWPSGGIRPDRIDSVLIFFAATDTMGAPLSPTDANMSMGYRYLRNAGLPAARPEFAPFILKPGPGYAYQDYRLGVPFTAYAGSTRLEVGFLENNVPGGRVDGRYFPPRSSEPGIDNTSIDGPMEWFFIFNSPYSGPNPNALLQCDILSTKTPLMWFGTPNRRVRSIPDGYQFILYSAPRTGPSDVFQFTIPAPLTSPAQTKASVNLIGVYPNPYYGARSPSTAGEDRRVTFTNLPPRATLRIYNLVGHLVRTLEKNDVSQFLEWNLQNDSGWLVASGMYIVHIELPDIGANKILKMAIIQEAVIPPVK